MTSPTTPLRQLTRETELDAESADVLADVLRRPTGISTAGYPYLERAAWQTFRDRLPHLFRRGLRVFRAIESIRDTVASDTPPDVDADNVDNACRVARQVLFTATITAPPDLWLLRHVLGNFAELGLTDRLLAGDAIYPANCSVDVDGDPIRLDETELACDLHFLLSRGMIEQYDDSFRIAGHPRVIELLDRIEPIAAPVEVPMTPVWRRLFSGTIADGDFDAIAAISTDLPTVDSMAQNHWIPTAGEVELAYRLLPLVLALRAESKTADLIRGAPVAAEDLAPNQRDLGAKAIDLLETAGWLDGAGDGRQVTAIGARGFSRGPGPFGIIEAYASYMDHGVALLLGDGDDVWVDRTKNVAASRDANPKTFRQANDNLDRFCDETGFAFSAFIEHAMGHGVATRQRFEQDGDGLDYFGADLEEAAIEAAEDERRRGRLPADMTLIGDADIGKPDVLLDAMRAEGVDPWGAVMVVGNGFHEIRGDTDDIIDVFGQYHDAGILLLFTEANALLVDDLRATAYNTYHAGFMYVHEKSGQNLRPATTRRKPRLGRELTEAWNECARQAGYVRADDYCGKSRTIYPYTPNDGHNPSISINHFFVPRQIADELELGS